VILFFTAIRKASSFSVAARLLAGKVAAKLPASLSRVVDCGPKTGGVIRLRIN
jgi:hypothetical protein